LIGLIDRLSLSVLSVCAVVEPLEVLAMAYCAYVSVYVVVEPLEVLAMAYCAYVSAELFHFSGIIRFLSFIGKVGKH